MGKGPILGVNVNAVNYWDTQFAFVDGMRMRSDWISNGTDGSWSNGMPIDLDEKGWVKSVSPGQIPSTMMLRSNQMHSPGGKYDVLYKGKGRLAYDFSANRDTAITVAPGHDVIDVTTADAGGIMVRILETDPTDYLRDIKVVMPGFIDTPDIFYPPFIKHISPFAVLRFMDWQGTNNSTVAKWGGLADMKAIDSAIDLCNVTGASPWFCIPHLADDDYILRHAAYVKSRLIPKAGRKIFIERSNEAWNWMFTQTFYGQTQGAMMNPPTNYLVYHLQRTREIGNLYKSVVGKDLCVNVLGSQSSSHDFDWWIPDWLANYGGTLDIDAFAIAPYMGITPTVDQLPIYAAKTVDDIFDDLRNGNLPGCRDMLTHWTAMAKQYGVRLLAYEGGQHLVGIGEAMNDETLNAKFYAVQRDPRMKQLYLDYFAMWNEITGGDVFCHYHDNGLQSKWGSWGSREWLEQPREQAPKYDALLTICEANAAVDPVPVPVPDPVPVPVPDPVPVPVPDPVPVPTPTPTPVESDEGVHASTVVDGTGAVWTIGPTNALLRDGADSGGQGKLYIYHLHAVFCQGMDDRYYVCIGGVWVAAGATDPTVVPTPAPVPDPVPVPVPVPVPDPVPTPDPVPVPVPVPVPTPTPTPHPVHPPHPPHPVKGKVAADMAAALAPKRKQKLLVEKRKGHDRRKKGRKVAIDRRRGHDRRKN